MCVTIGGGMINTSGLILNNKASLIENGFRRLGKSKNGSTVYKRVLEKSNVYNCLKHSSAEKASVVEFAYLDDAADKVVETATRRVGLKGGYKDATDRRLFAEFERSKATEEVESRFSHFVESQPYHYCTVNGKLPGTTFVAEHNIPNSKSLIGRESNFASFNTQGELTQRGRVRISELPATENGLQEVYLLDRGLGSPKTGYIESSYTSHEIAAPGDYVRGIKGTENYISEKAAGIPKYTSLTDLKAQDVKTGFYLNTSV